MEIIMCGHIWKKINNVKLCVKCGMTVCNDKFVIFDKKIANRLRKLADK